MTFDGGMSPLSKFFKAGKKEMQNHFSCSAELKIVACNHTECNSHPKIQIVVEF